MATDSLPDTLPVLPVGICVVLALAIAALFLWLVLRSWEPRRKYPPGRCWHCGYNRTGLRPGVTCPECGQRK